MEKYKIVTWHKWFDKVVNLQWWFDAVLVNANAQWVNGYITTADGKLRTETFNFNEFYIEIYDTKGNKIFYGGKETNVQYSVRN